MNILREEYKKRHNNILLPMVDKLEGFIKDLLEDFDRIDRVTVRAKSVDSFLEKSQRRSNGEPKYSDPLKQIQDQIGARIVTFYKDDVDQVINHVLKYFRHIELKELIPESESEFGYFGKHLILLLPSDILEPDCPEAPLFFELQIKTLFQHSWSEANHDLGYKSSENLDSDIKRQIAFVSAQAWGADEIFNQLFRKLIKNKN